MSETRLARVGDQIQREIASLLSAGQVKDERIGFVTITAVKLTPDMKEAKVYFTAHGSEAEQAATAEALARNAGRFRAHVGRTMKIRHAPLLRFVHDASIEEGAKIERLLKEVREKEGW
jgi:ribosome-binding factor A